MEPRGTSTSRPGRNRSMPAATIIPVLSYPDICAAACWLQRAFGFRERLRVADHRAQLEFGDACVVVRKGFHPLTVGAHREQGVMVRLVGIERHHERALAAGARIISPPTRYPYGEIQYTALDPGGHAWVFSETFEDTDPAEWGVLLRDAS